MKSPRLLFLSTLLIAAALMATNHMVSRVPDIKDSTGTVTLPNGWRIAPAGKHVKLPGDLPMKMISVDAGSRVLVLTAGFHDHSLSVMDPRTAKLAATLDVVKAWDGMAFDAATGTVYVSGGGRAKPSFGNALAHLASPPAMLNFVYQPILRVQYAN